MVQQTHHKDAQCTNYDEVCENNNNKLLLMCICSVVSVFFSYERKNHFALLASKDPSNESTWNVEIGGGG